MKIKTDLFTHELIPKHIILSDKEKGEVIKKFGIERMNQFPKILKTDPVIKMIDAKLGDLIKIIRKNEIGEHSIYYRMVIEG